MSDIGKALISADIQMLELVLELSRKYEIERYSPEFIAALRRLRAKFEKDLVDEAG